MKNVTLSDIARKTGYSVNTVSHALKNKPDISDETKKYIIKVANQMGYIGNLSASALRSGKTMSIAIIVSDISNPHFSIMVKEMETRLREYGYTAFIMNTGEDEALEHAAIVSALSKKTDGIILCPVQKKRDNIDFLEKKEIPYVLFGRRTNNLTSSYVLCDDIHGGFAAAEHLIKLNHREILFLNAPEYISSAKDRLAGIRSAFQAYSIPEEHLHISTIGITGKNHNIPKALKVHESCTGIICFSDILALETCHYLKLQGKTVPNDVSVIGFDNIASKYRFPLMLTSVSSSKTKMSIQAVDTLMNIIKGESTTIRLILHTEVISRESTKAL